MEVRIFMPFYGSDRHSVLVQTKPVAFLARYQLTLFFIAYLVFTPELFYSGFYSST